MIRRFFDGVSKTCIVLCLVTIFAWTLCSCLFVEMNAKLVTSIIEQSAGLTRLAAWYILLVGAWGIIEYLLDIVNDALFANTDCATFKTGFDGAYNTKPEILKKANAGYITGLIRTLQSKRSDLMLFLISEGVMGVLYVVYFAIRLTDFHWVFSVILVTIVICGTTIRVVGKKLVMPITNRLIEADSVVTKIFIDVVTNINTVQKMQAHKFMRSKLDKALDDYYVNRVKNIAANDIFYCVFKFVVYLFAPICLLITTKHEFSFDTIEFYALLSPLSVQLVHMAKSIARFFKRLDLYVSAQNKVDKIINKDTENQSSLVHEFNTVDIRNADYSYEHGITKNRVRVQIPFLRVSYGDKICIYGESGQGKTTTLNILSRQIETDNVYINGKQSTDRVNCVFISQDTEIFDMSIRDNLTLGNPLISDNELIHMICEVGLSEWYKSQSHGLDTLLGERGVFVSTGQRQRLNLIRGLLIEDKDLYLLDEPTSNVDEETELKMVRLISTRLMHKTVVIVSHRKAIASMCNKFYKFENGICGDASTSFNA